MHSFKENYFKKDVFVDAFSIFVLVDEVNR